MLLEEKRFLKEKRKGILESFVAPFLIILFAIILFKNPENFIASSIQIFGYGAVFIGVLNVLLYFRSSLEQKLLGHRFMLGLLLISFGIVTFFEVEVLTGMTTFLLGGYLLFQNASRLELILNLKKYTKKLWIYLSGFSILNFLLSLLLIINPWEGVWALNTYLSVLLIVIEVIYILIGICILVGVKENGKEEEK